MIRKTPLLLQVIAGFTTLVLFQSNFAHNHIDVEYAEQQPLAQHSLLLDVTRQKDRFIAVGERGHIMISADGNTWTQSEHVPTRSTLTTVFALKKRVWAGGHDAVILTSADGGKNWSRLFYDPERQQAVMDIHFTDENNGVAIGSYGLYLVTQDAGETWEERVVDEESDYHLNRLLDLGDGKWLIAGEAGYSYRSYDYGENWELLDMPYQGSMWGAQRSSEECVIFFGLRGHVLESCDFGMTWEEVETGSEASISDAARYEDLVLLAANSGTLMIRDDSGRFSTYHHSSGVDFSSVLSLGDGRFLLVGEDGSHYYPEAEK
jgi:photosystem II stability/assembly factor-like uncharacterized protein